MRPIKFRAWDKKNKRMLPVDKLMQEYDGVLRFRHNTAVEKNATFNEVLDIMQFTGLHDKNGKEIWEGDVLHFQNSILSSNDPKPDYRVVKWNEEYGAFAHAYIDGNVETSGFTFCKSNAGKHFEVIGNVYEHPHLIEKSV